MTASDRRRYTGTSCGAPPDLCSGVLCQNDGTCAAGVCDCGGLHSGSFCEIAPTTPCFVVSVAATVDCGVHGASTPT